LYRQRGSAVFKSALFGFVLVVACASLVGAQGSGCNAGCNSLPIGTDYTQSESFSACDSDDSSFSCFGTCDQDCSALTRCRYISGFGGWNYHEDFVFADAGDVPDGADVNSGSLDDGELFGVAIGAQVHPVVRYELEAAYRNNDAEDWRIQQFAGGVVTSDIMQAAIGNLESYSGMANFIFDFAPRQRRCPQPYAGVGFGFLSVEGNFTTATNNYVVNDTSVAWQFIGGINQAVTQRIDAFVEYRFIASTHISVFDTTIGSSLGDFEINNNSFLGGLRFRF
jgi:opacity protein-like surface antigen